MNIRRRGILIGLASSAGAALVPLAVVYACSAMAVVTPSATSGPVGSQVVVDMTNVYSGYDVNLTLAGQLVWSGVAPGVLGANAMEEVKPIVTVPSMAPGNYVFTATISDPSSSAVPFVAHGAYKVTQPASVGSTQPISGSTSTGVRPGAPSSLGSPQVVGSATDSPAVSAIAAGPESDVLARAAARDGVTGASVALLAPTKQPNGAQVFATPETSNGSSGLSGLAIGAIALAVVLPLMVMGFGAVTAYQRRTARATNRKDQ